MSTNKPTDKRKRTATLIAAAVAIAGMIAAYYVVLHWSSCGSEITGMSYMTAILMYSVAPSSFAYVKLSKI